MQYASYDLEVYGCIYWLAQTNTRLAQSVERQPFKLVAVGSSPTSGGGKRQSLGLEPEVSREMERQNPKQKRCLTVLSEINERE